MILILLIICMAACVIGIFTDLIPIGIVFIIALASFLYTLITFCSKGTKLTVLGKVIMVISLMSLAYCIPVLFFGIDVKAILGL